MKDKVRKLLLNINKIYADWAVSEEIFESRNDFLNVWLFMLLKNRFSGDVSLKIGTKRFKVFDSGIKIIVANSVWLNYGGEILDIFNIVDKNKSYAPIIDGEEYNGEYALKNKIEYIEVGELKRKFKKKLGIKKTSKRFGKIKSYLDEAITADYKLQLFNGEVSKLFED